MPGELSLKRLKIIVELAVLGTRVPKLVLHGEAAMIEVLLEVLC